MRVLMICFVYNEIKYLPHTIDYYKRNGCEIYVIDNMSNDGTWEWLRENGIRSHRVDTGESFDLRILQKEIIKTLPELNPDWVVYAGADLYYIAGIPLKDYIGKVEKMGYNQLSMECWSAFNTGETPGTPLPAHFYYALPWKHIVMISKYLEGFSMQGDCVTIDNARCYLAKHAMAINYGACKPIEEQKVKLERRKKAWANGMRPQQGRHFLKGEKINWLRDKGELKDLRTLPEYKFILRMLESPVLFGSEPYNKLYAESIQYKMKYQDMVYYKVWKYISGLIKADCKVLELGCGPGHLAHMLSDMGLTKYTGIDFSGVAIEMARKKVPAFRFVLEDLMGVDYSAYTDHVLVSTETFEHLADDIALIRKLPKNQIIFSVPDYMCEHHVRVYESESFIRNYYGDVLNIDTVKEFGIGKNRKMFVISGMVK